MADLSRWTSRRRPASPPEAPPVVPPKPEPAQGPAVRAAGPRGERTRTVAVRLSPEEHATWLAVAKQSGRGQMGRWVRETVAARLQGRREPVRVEGAGELRADLSRVGSNLNQIARALNTAARGGESGPDVETVLRVVKDAKKTMGEIRDRLSGTS
jgi:hypothetical protein